MLVLSNSIKKYREKANYTQIELAEALGVDHSTVSKWEVKGALPRAKHLSRMCELFNCDIKDLLSIDYNED